jgi:RND superfamily putative drug exporter
MRRPVLIGATVLVVLVALGSPFLRADFGLPSYIVLPKGAESRHVSETLAARFDANLGDSFSVVVDGRPRRAAVERFAAAVAHLPGVARTVPNVTTRGAWVTVVPAVPLVSSRGEALVTSIRALPAPFEFGVEGRGAELVDTKAAILSRLPWALGIIATATFVLLFLSFGSILIPLKAIVLNLVSLTATFGAMVWVFQEGHLGGVLGITTNGQLDVTMPILMFCIAFGLSMDYEVFLLSRIKEEHDLTGDNTHAVAVGLERSGRIVTAAAALLAVTFIAFGTSGVSIIKLFGFGLALAIVMDATVIRGLLVPAFMRLAGEANWWAPAPLARFQQRYGFREGDVLLEEEPQLVGTV